MSESTPAEPGPDGPEERTGRARREQVRATALGLVLLLATVLYGAVETWARGALGLTCAVWGLWVVGRSLHGGREMPGPGRGSLLLAGAAILLGAVHLVPLPAGLVEAIAPWTASLRLEVAPDASGPVSVDLLATEGALVVLAAMGTVLLLVAPLARRRRGRRRVAAALVVPGALLALYGLLLHGSGGGLPRIYPTVPLPDRLASTLRNPNHFAGLCLLVAPLAVAVVRDEAERAGGLRRALTETRGVLAAAALVGIACACVLTRSRAGILLLGPTLVAAGVLGRTGRPLSRELAGVVGLILLAGLGAWTLGLDPVLERFEGLGRAEARGLGGRVEGWEAALEVAGRQPVTGTGPGTFPEASRDAFAGEVGAPVRLQHAHSEPLEVLAEAGVPGILLLLAALLVLGLGYRGRHGDPYRAGALAGLLGIGVHSLVDFPLRMPSNALVAAVLLGLAVTPGRGRSTGRPTRAIVVLLLAGLGVMGGRLLLGDLAGRRASVGQVDAARRAAALLPESAGAHLLLGRALEARGRPDEAAEAYLRACRISPVAARPRALLALHRIREGRVEEGERLLAGAIRLDPVHPDLLARAILHHHLRAVSTEGPEAVVAGERRRELLDRLRRVDPDRYVEVLRRLVE